MPMECAHCGTDLTARGSFEAHRNKTGHDLAISMAQLLGHTDSAGNKRRRD